MATGSPKRPSLRSGTDLRVFTDSIELAKSAAELITGLATEPARDAGRQFAVALSGGQTPRDLYAELARVPRVDYTSWEVFWVDERWVPKTHTDSNYGLVDRVFLSRVRIPPDRVHPVPTDEASPEQAAESYAGDIVRTLGPVPVFDVVLLGLGTDGHTASLFPGTAALGETERIVAANWVSEISAHRVTMTFPTLNRARHVILLVSGREKAGIVQRVLDPTTNSHTPAAAVRPYAGTLHWLLDKDAASQLTESVKQP